MDKLSKRNVVDMTDYRADEGFSALGQVEGYWEALRGARLLPKRCEIDPRGIESALEYTFVLERITIGMARMRIAGSHLNNLMGMEVRGMPLTSFITPNSRSQMGDVLEEVFQRPAVCELHLSAEIGRKKSSMEARMLLLPLTSDMGDVSRILGCLIARGDMGEKPRRFDISDVKMRALSPEETILPKAVTLASVDDNNPAAGFAERRTQYQGQPNPPAKPYLRLVTTDGR